MSGLLAIFNPDGVDGALADLIDRFPSHAAKRDEWRDPHFAAVRFHHGLLEAEPQPVSDQTGTLRLFLDGQIYDAGDAGAGDPAAAPAAVCLAAYRQGAEALARLNGSFSLLVYDAKRRRLALVSDHLNSRPLFFFQAGREVVVASHITALTAHPKCPKTLDRQTLHELVSYRRVVGRGTTYRGIERVGPASIVEFDGGPARARTYWQMRWRDPSFSRGEAAEVVAEGFRRAVGRRIARHPRSGIFLSGGLDSRIMLAAADPPPVCFSMGDVETQQVQIAREAARLHGAPFHYLPVAPDSFRAHFDQAVRLTGAMYAAHSNHFLPILDTVRRDCDLVLTGNHIDTMFRGGFLPPRKLRLGGAAHPLPWLAALPAGDLVPIFTRTQKQAFAWPLAEQVLTPAARAEHEARLQDAMRGVLEGFEAGARHFAWEHVVIRSIDQNYAFPNTLCIRGRMDESAIAWDRELVEIALQLPAEWCHPDAMFRAALGRLSPPLVKLVYANTGLPASVQPWTETTLTMLGRARRQIGRKVFGQRPTSGPDSWLDFNGLLRQQGPLRDRLIALPESEAMAACGIFGPAGLAAVIDIHLKGEKNIAKFLVMLMTIENWVAQFGADGCA